MTEQRTIVEEMTLQEARDRYIRTLGAGKADAALEITHFVRWFSSNRTLRGILPAEIERYGEHASKNIEAAPRRLEAVRGFLAFAKKQGYTENNLGVHLRLRRTGPADTGNDTVNQDRIEMSAEGLAAFKEELQSLTAQRPQIAEELRLARADGDFRENAPLDAAREKQAMIEARIRELEAMLKRAIVVDNVGEGSDRVRMGCRVKLRNLSNNSEVEYTLVGPGEVNASLRRISIQSPVGKAVIDHRPGDEVEVSAPAGIIRFRIESVEI